MRRILPFMILLGCASCQREEPATAKANPEAAPAKPAARNTPGAGPAELRPLLETPRVFISGTGQVFSIKANPHEHLDEILADLNTLPASQTRDRIFKSLIADLAKTDPAAARLLLKEWHGLAEEWCDAAEAVASELGKSDPAAVSSFISQEVPRDMQIDVWGAFLDVLPAAERVGWLDPLPEGHAKLHVIGSMIRSWVIEDPAALAAWLDGFAPGKGAEEMDTLNDLWGRFNPASNDPLGWLAAFHAAETPEAQRFFAENACRFASEEQKAQWRIELAEAVPGLNDGSDKRPWRDDPAAWATKLPESGIAGLPAEDAKDLIRTWGQKNPRMALEWALTHGRPEGVQALDLLYYQEPKEALAMAPNLAAGKERDEVLERICTVAAYYGDGDSARTLLPLISDPKKQEWTRKQVEERLKKGEK